MIQSYLYKLLKAGSFSYELLLTKDSKQAQDACEVFSLFRISPFVLPELPIRYGDDLSSFREDFYIPYILCAVFMPQKSPRFLFLPLRVCFMLCLRRIFYKASCSMLANITILALSRSALSSMAMNVWRWWS